MLFVDIVSWWYGHGWVWTAKHLFITRTTGILQFFSVKDLLKTLFSPFRQDALNARGAPVGVRLQAFGMNIISRIFGLIIRTILIMAGLVMVAVNMIVASFLVIVWPLLPISPALAIVLMIMRVGA